MGQASEEGKGVNVVYGYALLAQIDGLAEHRNLKRNDLLRDIARAAVEAKPDVDPVSEPAPPPLDLVQLAGLMTMLEHMGMEFDRALRDQDRRAKRLQQTFDAGESARQNALSELTGQIAGRLQESEAPFRSEVAALGTEIEARMDRHASALAAQVQPLDARIAKLEKRAAALWLEPRVRLNDWEFRGLEIWCLVIIGFIASFLLLIMAAKWAPNDWVALPVSRSLFGSEEVASCELFKQAYGTERCPTMRLKTSRKEGGR